MVSCNKYYKLHTGCVNVYLMKESMWWSQLHIFYNKATPSQCQDILLILRYLTSLTFLLPLKLLLLSYRILQLFCINLFYVLAILRFCCTWRLQYSYTQNWKRGIMSRVNNIQGDNPLKKSVSIDKICKYLSWNIKHYHASGVLNSKEYVARKALKYLTWTDGHTNNARGWPPRQNMLDVPILDGHNCPRSISLWSGLRFNKISSFIITLS